MKNKTNIIQATSRPLTVILAHTGIQIPLHNLWIPACAGMTKCVATESLGLKSMVFTSVMGQFKEQLHGPIRRVWAVV